MRWNVRFYAKDPSSLTCQLGLRWHSVLTSSHGRAMVVGFEGALKDDKKRHQVLSLFSRVIDQHKNVVQLENAFDKKTLKKWKRSSKAKKAVEQQL